eukprot:2410245-Prymnesium_polylepis.1
MSCAWYARGAVPLAFLPCLLAASLPGCECGRAQRSESAAREGAARTQKKSLRVMLWPHRLHLSHYTLCIRTCGSHVAPVCVPHTHR